MQYAMLNIQDITSFFSRKKKALAKTLKNNPARFFNSKKRCFLTIITRVKNEPFLAEFVHYYLSQGADKIYILDDNSSLPFDASVLHNPRVTIKPCRAFAKDEMSDARLLYQNIRNESTWFALIDADEFITARLNQQWTIQEELKNNFAGADCIKVPWVMMSGNGREKDPYSLLGEIIHRWDHDRRHPHPDQWHKGRCRYDQIEVKCIFRGAAFTELANSHHPGGASAQGARTFDSIRIREAPLDPFYNNLREHDIAAGHLLCYHYRMISRESCLRKSTDSNFAAYKVGINALLACDYPEIIDRTLQNKI